MACQKTYCAQCAEPYKKCQLVKGVCKSCIARNEANKPKQTVDAIISSTPVYSTNANYQS